jgi:hypothetical protein
VPNGTTAVSVKAVRTFWSKVASWVAALTTVPTTCPAAMIAAFALACVVPWAIAGLAALLEPARTTYWNCHN